MSNNSTSHIPVGDLENSPSAKWDAGIGTSYAGKIVSLAQRQQTDPNTGQARYFGSGDPMMVWVITIEQANGDRVALWASGGNYKVASGEGTSMLSAIGIAVRNANAAGVDVGADLAVAHTGMGPKEGSKNAPRLFTAQYRPASSVAASIPANDLFAGQS